MDQLSNSSFADKMVMVLDTGLRTLLNNPNITERPDPSKSVSDSDLSEQQKKHIAGLMRINHCGEVCAQGLYQGQSLTARTKEVRDKMNISAQEENDHLKWTADRLEQLGSHTSHLNPLFYVGSLAMGTMAGLVGDKWSLGFVAETERQVVKHLEDHLQQLPESDKKSISILEMMKEDELRHATKAIEAGASELPMVVKKLMQLSSKVMTRSTYWI